VTIIDRDRFVEQAEFRNGAPQSRHLHILLARGHRIMERLFPGLDAELDAAGVPMLNLGLDVNAVAFGGKVPDYPSQYQTRSSSRVLLESIVRRRLKQDTRVKLIEEAEVTAVQTNAGRSVTGVRVQRRGKGQETIDADLVIDASGRNSRAPQWLEALGYAAPAVTTINAFLGYATRWYRKPENFNASWKAVLTGSRPTTNPRGGGLFPVEEDRWVLTLAGTARQYPPTDDEGFLDFARNLIDLTIYETIKELDPLSPIYGYRRTENRWMHFERLRRWPDRFIVLGDAACCFNPIYGQGMTVSALEAMLLDRLLREQSNDLSGLAHRFQRQLPEAVNAAWLLATGEDFRWPSTEGGKPGPAVRFAHWYVDRIFEVMPDSAWITESFLAVQQLIEPPAALFRPAIFARVIGQVAKSIFRRDGKA
jgi:2-polyprenyl-6-methoxyphenol hydroxylase-like FAD-dependent oxidoreductase